MMMRKRAEFYSKLKRPKCLQLIACVIVILLAVTEGSLIEGEQEQQQPQPQQRQIDSSEIKGWTEVNKLWPLEDGEFFVSFEKGHHFIEVKLPSKIDDDFMVKLEYFYNYAKVRPLLQMVACTSHIDLITENRSQANGTWLQHEVRVKSADCDRRKVLTYNVVLHDAQDIFAWRQIEIRSVNSEATTPTPVHVEVTTQSSPPNTQQGEASSSGNGEITEATRETVNTEPQTTQATTTVNQESNTPVTESATIEEQTTSTEPSSEPTSTVPGVEINTTLKPEAENTEPIESTTISPDSGVTNVSQYMKDLNEKIAAAKPFFPTVPDSEQPTTIDENSRSKREIFSEEAQNWFAARMKRSADRNEPLNMVCKPSSCDGSRFNHPRFIAMVNGVPRVPTEEITRGTHKFYLSTDAKPLNFSLDYRGDLSQVDICTDFRLFMDHGTSVEFLLEDKLLERIERRPSDSAAGQWEIFKRCISDYMPRLPTTGTNVHTVHMALVPHKPQAVGGAKQVAVFMKKDGAIPLRVLYPTRDYLPNIDRLNESSLNDIWVTDKDGVQKPTLKFGEGHKLHISNIDSKQEYFDMTSRWLQVKDLEILEDPVLFVYAAQRAPWIKSIEFEYQNANRTDENESGWISQTVYVARTQSETNSSPITNSSETALANSNARASEDMTSTPGSVVPVASTTQTSQQQSPQVRTISESELLIPIKMKNLNSNEFRIRTRHHLTETARLEDSLELNITALAFGDACAEGNYCLNRGICQPIGVARAECTCLTGYSGSRCEIVRPCEVIYGNQTGKDLCESIGARCADDLTVLRCRWPGDPLYDPSQNTTGSGGESATAIPSSEDWNQLKENSDRQARMLIVMGVFMLAFLLFAVVIVASMVSRLMRSKRRLKQAQIEVHELSRRPEPTTSGAAIFGGRSVGRHKQPPAAISYNNQSFDAD